MTLLRLVLLGLVVAALAGCGGSEKGRERPRAHTCPGRAIAELPTISVGNSRGGV
jgi:hypothetical protein